MIHYIATTGFFDGVHKGHVAVLNRLKEIGDNKKLPVCVITFWPHPRLVLNNEPDKLKLLSTVEEKIQCIKSLGIDEVFIIPFTKELSEISPKEFIENELVKKYGVQGLCIGYDHHIGKNRSGGFDTVKQICREAEIYCEQVQPLTTGEIIISSQKIRNYLLEGDIKTANSMLGYHYNLSGNVVDGSKLGRTIGFPTANIAVGDPFKLIPAKGVYAVKIKIDGYANTLSGMLYIGEKPTVDSSGKTFVEVNIFDFNDNIYNKNITVFFEYFIRGEVKFEDVEKMKKQLVKDKQKVVELLK